ncbi:hypothetical protein N9B60_00035 [Mariniblastus sp.]|nr:hypothetical protein [Mariniblastus sp.]MDA7925441.1 hypothetical protein [Mariniblastus sp.]
MKYQWFLILVMVSANIGCAKLGQTTLSEDLLGEQAAWLDDSSEGTDQLVENEGLEEEESGQEQSKTVDLADRESTDISVKLTAKPEKKSSDQPVEINPINCGHSLECDCQNFKKPPKLPYAAPSNPPVSTPLVVFDNHSLTPLNKKPAGQTNPVHDNRLNLLRPRRTPKVLGPLAIKPKSRLQPMPSERLATSSPSTSNDGLDTLPQQTTVKGLTVKGLTIKDLGQSSNKIKTDRLASRVAQPCANCDQISCRGNCPNTETSEDQGWDKLFAFDVVETGDCPDCEAGLCETKDMIITPEYPIVITEPPFAILPTPPLADTAPKSDAFPPITRNQIPDSTEVFTPNKPVAKPVAKPDTQTRQVNGFDRENMGFVEHAFVPPATLNSEPPIAKAEMSPSNAFVPRTEKDANNPSLNPVDEKNQLDASIQKLKGQLDFETDSNRRNAIEINLQLFEFLRHQLANDGTLTSISAEEKKYWEHQLEAIETMTQGGGEEATEKATDATLDNLRMAMNRLEAMAELQIMNSAICSEIKGFGKHKPFPENKFQPGQPFLVYCEIENYESIEQEINLERVVQSRFQGGYQIENEAGQLVQSGQFPIIEDNAPKRRRDFYLYFKIELNELEPGNYRLRMEIEDLNGQKKGNLEQDLLFNVQ